jgi:hypothetical protein
MSVTFRPVTFAAALAATFALLAPASAQPAGPRLDVPFVPTPPQVVERMLELAQVTKDDFLIDLGSGDGRIPIAAAKRGARAFGVDIDPKRIAEARENAKTAGVTDKVNFNEQNLFDTKIGDASVLTMYLLWHINLELRPRILSELKPGTRVVSHAFDLGDWEADRHDVIDGRHIYMWVVPAQVAGRWQVQHGPRQFIVDLEQKHQRVSGTATVDGKASALQSVRVNGAQIDFIVSIDGKPTLFAGEATGDAIQPRQTPNAGDITPAQNWRASRARAS